jgi:hypothetical protein
LKAASFVVTMAVAMDEQMAVAMDVQMAVR